MDSSLQNNPRWKGVCLEERIAKGNPASKGTNENIIKKEISKLINGNNYSRGCV